MDDLQYLLAEVKMGIESKGVLNLVINGWPSILFFYKEELWIQLF